MPQVPLRTVRGVRATQAGPTVELDAGFAAIRAELGIPDEFPPEVLAEAEAAAAAAAAASGPGHQRADRRDVPFVTIDPPDSRDLDQAVFIRRRPGGGYGVSYAIADAGSFVVPDGALDAEARRRGVTVYLPDRRTPLHPVTLSEDRASLLPDGDRPALVWDFDLDGDGHPVDVRVGRATVRSRAKLSYEGVQQALDAGTAEEPLQLLAEVGRLRQARELARGGISLPLPEQQVVEIDGRYELRYRAPVPVESWNAQISLLTGMSAARIMVEGGIGVLRVVVPPDEGALATLRRRARALGVPWSDGQTYGDVVRSLRDGDHGAAAFLVQAARLFRGASYVSFDGIPPAASEGVHAAVAAHYAHVTAPLRRLVDRFANEIVLALTTGAEVPSWVREALAALPVLMNRAIQRENTASARARDLVEAAVLAGCAGCELEGIVVDVHHDSARVQIRDPAVVATLPGRFTLGAEVTLRVAGADVTARAVEFDVLDVQGPGK